MIESFQAIRLSVLAGSMLVSAAAHGQQISSPGNDGAVQPVSKNDAGLGDIVVTAEKRSSSAQRTPISIIALSADQLAQAQVRTLTDMQQLVPGFKIGDNDGNAQVTVRGIGSAGFLPAGENPVAVNQNGVFISRPIAQLAGMFDLSSIEVLKGPQGTLYGRNATAGSVNIATTMPTNDWSGFGRVTVGNYAAVNVEAAVGGPIVDDKVLVRIAGFIDRHNGYGRNLVTGTGIEDKSAWGMRGTLLLRLTDDFSGTIMYEHYDQDDNNAALHYFGPAGLTGLPGATGQLPLSLTTGGFVPSNLRDIAQARDPVFRLRVDAVTGILDWNLGAVELKSITGYRAQNSLTITPLGGSNTDIFYMSGEPAHQFSEELQMNYTSDKLRATAGFYYFNERDTANPSTAPFPSAVIQGFFGIPVTTNYLVDVLELVGTQKTEALAAFGQATYQVTNELSVTAGVRYSSESKEAFLRPGFSLTAPFIQNTPFTNDSPLPPVVAEPKVTFHSTTPKFAVQYQFASKTLAYASYSKGFKSGGYDISTVSPAFQPEKLTAYEVGLKTTIPNNRLRVNVAGFLYDYSNLQVLQVIGSTQVTTNAASARIYGIEGQIDAIITDQFKIEALGSYLHTRYGSYTGPDAAQPLLPVVNFSGNRLNNAPTFQAYAAGTYTLQLGQGELAARVDGEYSTRYYFTSTNIPLLSQKAYAKVNASLTYKDPDNWQITGFIKNIGNQTTRTSGIVNSIIFGNPAQGAIAAPRIFGAEVRYIF
jgi:iron complex outermembrane recepter protein